MRRAVDVCFLAGHFIERAVEVCVVGCASERLCRRSFFAGWRVVCGRLTLSVCT